MVQEHLLRQKNKKTKNKDIKKYSKKVKYIGLICGYSGAIQSGIYTLLAIGALVFIFVENNDETAVTHKVVYFSLEAQETSPACVWSPISIIFLIILYFGLSIAWFVISLRLILAYTHWESGKLVESSGKLWIIFTSVLCVLDLFMFFLFLGDVYCIAMFQKHEHKDSDKPKPDDASTGKPGETGKPEQTTRQPEQTTGQPEQPSEKPEQTTEIPEQTGKPDAKLFIPEDVSEDDNTISNNTDDTNVNTYKLINPFFQPKIRQNYPWPKVFDVGKEVLLRQHSLNKTTTKTPAKKPLKLPKPVTLKPKKPAKPGSEQDDLQGEPVIYAPIVLMTFILRGYFFWISNVIFVVLFAVYLRSSHHRKSFVTLRIVKQRVYYDT